MQTRRAILRAMENANFTIRIRGAFPIDRRNAGRIGAIAGVPFAMADFLLPIR